MSRKVVLHIVRDLDVAGAQTVMMNYLRWFQDDKDYSIKVVVLGPRKNSDYEKECDEKGFNVSYCNYTPFTKIPIISTFLNWVRLNILVASSIHKESPYVIHSHQTSVIPFTTLPFYFSGVEKRYHTLHSDPYAVKKGYAFWAKIAFNIFGICPICVTEDQAEKSKKRYHIRKLIVVHNGLDTDEYINDTLLRDHVRHSFGIEEDTFVIGTVGRFSKIKNHGFLLQLFAEFCKKHPNSLLMLVGDGEEKYYISCKVEELNIKDKVLFTGQREDVARFYNAMDLFMLTSFFESSSIVTVEAQLSGLRCVVADSVPSNVVVSDKVNRISLNSEMSVWIEAMEGKIKAEEKIYPVSDFSKDGIVKKLKFIYR